MLMLYCKIKSWKAWDVEGLFTDKDVKKHALESYYKKSYITHLCTMFLSHFFDIRLTWVKHLQLVFQNKVWTTDKILQKVSAVNKMYVVLTCWDFPNPLFVTGQQSLKVKWPELSFRLFWHKQPRTFLSVRGSFSQLTMSFVTFLKI